MLQAKPKRSRKIRVLALIAVLGCGLGSARAGQLALAPGDQAPTIRGETFSSGRKVFDYGSHRYTLVNFWATWCLPCRQEMPALQKLLAELGADEIQIIGVLRDRPEPGVLEQYLETLGIEYWTVLADERINKAWGGIATLPTTFLIGPDGRILRRYVGATPKQIEGIDYDVRATFEGKPLGPFIYPEEGGMVNEDERPSARSPETP